jgi:hypothetical protein
MSTTIRRRLRGARLRALVRMLAQEEGLSPDLAERLARRFETVVRHVRLRRGAIERLRPFVTASGDTTVAAAADQTAAAAPFDPFSFSIVALVMRSGEAALASKLAGIECAEHLRALARAQHISLGAEIDSDPTATATALRAAILAGARQRIADRKAAAG